MFKDGGTRGGGVNSTPANTLIEALSPGTRIFLMLYVLLRFVVVWILYCVGFVYLFLSPDLVTSLGNLLNILLIDGIEYLVVSSMLAIPTRNLMQHVKLGRKHYKFAHGGEEGPGPEDSSSAEASHRKEEELLRKEQAATRANEQQFQSKNFCIRMVSVVIVVGVVLLLQLILVKCVWGGGRG